MPAVIIIIMMEWKTENMRLEGGGGGLMYVSYDGLIDTGSESAQIVMINMTN